MAVMAEEEFEGGKGSMNPKPPGDIQVGKDCGVWLWNCGLPNAAEFVWLPVPCILHHSTLDRRGWPHLASRQ